MSVLSSIRSIIRHPMNRDAKGRAIIRYVYFHVFSMLMPDGFVGRFASHSTLLYKRGLAGAVGNYYNALDDYEDMCFLLHYLRADDLLIDIGANVGSYSVLAAAECGCRVIAFEPIPETASYLRDNLERNGIQELVEIRACCVGDVNGAMFLSTARGAMNHVVKMDSSGSIRVESITLEGALCNRNPTVIKLDVEGFEYRVLAGAPDVLKQKTLNVLIVELNGSGKRYGDSDASVHEILLKNGFLPYRYLPLERRFASMNSYRTDTFNTLYIRDIQLARQRVMGSATRLIRDRMI